MTLLQNGIASSVVTLVILILGGLLWAVVSPRWPIFVLGWLIGIGSIILAGRVRRWWNDGK